MLKTLIVVPMKTLSVSKTRLASSLSNSARIRLVRLLYQKTLNFLIPIAAKEQVEIAVVTKCKYAKEWWLENEKKWDIVRNIWAEIYSQNKNLSLKSEYNGKRLYEYLLFSNEYKDYSEIDKLISSFIIK